jgi:hypothetical protein
MTAKTTLIRIDASIHSQLKEHLKGRVPFKPVGAYVGELILDTLKRESQINAETKEEDLP